MTVRAPRSRARRSPVILVFGESLNDAQSVVHLLAANNHSLSARLVPRPRPTSLTRTAGHSAVSTWLQAMMNVVAQTEAAGRPVKAIVVHQDADGPDAAGGVAARLEVRLHAALGQIPAHAAVPIQMTEAWWFLFPEAVEAVAPRAWRGVMPRHARDVEEIADPKAELKRLTRRSSREYAEADSPEIARAVLTQRLTPLRVCTSYERLVGVASAL